MRLSFSSRDYLILTQTTLLLVSRSSVTNYNCNSINGIIFSPLEIVITARYLLYILFTDTLCSKLSLSYCFRL